MSDLIERLRAQRDHADDWRTTLAEEAADEIDRLRRENEKLQGEVVLRAMQQADLRRELAEAREMLRKARDAYWLEITRTSLPSDPPDELLARLDDFLRGAGGPTKMRDLLVLARDYIEANQGGWCRDGVGSGIILKHIDAFLAEKP